MISQRLALVAAAWIGSLPLAAAVTAAPTQAPPSWSAESDQTDAHMGHSVASAGDVNGDGYADVIVGAPFYDNGQSDEGRAYVYLGSAAGLAPLAAWTVESNVVNANLGSSVAGAGDVNGDGYDDVIVGVPGDSNGSFGEGRAYLYHGSVSGLAAVPSRMLDAANQQFAGFGGSVGSAGDVNGDGYADVIVGASGYGSGQIAEGRAWVFHGSATGIGTTSAWSIESNQAGAEFGYSVGTAGDVNGDGYADVIVGAWRYDNLGSGSDDGRAFVYQGSAAGLATTPAWTLAGNQVGAQLGQSVATAGDFNGDGYADVIVGAPAHDDSTVDSGRVYVAFGSAGGLQAAVVWTPSGYGLPLNPLRFGTAVGSADVNGDGFSDLLASSPNWGNGVVLTLSGNPTEALEFFVGDRFFQGAVFGQQLGFSAAGAGDVNNDGYDEVIAGANLLDNGQSDEGGAFAYSGVPGAPYPWRDGDMVTHYQSVWGSTPTTTNPAGLVLANYNNLYPIGLFEIGIPGASGFSLSFTSPGALLQFLPTVGLAGTLNADLVNPISSSSGTFGGDLAALKLNIDFSDANILQGNAGFRFGDLRVCRTTFANVNNLTVRQIATIANTLIGRGPSPVSFDDMEVVVVNLTNAFDDGAVSQDARDHLVSGTCSVPEPGFGLSLVSGMVLLAGLKLRSGGKRSR